MSNLKSENIVQSKILAAFEKDGLKHGFFTKNIKIPKDIAKRIKEDQTHLDLLNEVAHFFHIPNQNIALLSQIHSSLVMIIDKKNYCNFFQADALVTKEKNIALGILTADCGPLLFYDTKQKIIGAAHAGWRGAFDGIVENTVKAMEQLGAHRSNIKASLGPSIGPCHYIVDQDYKENFLQKNAIYENFFQPLKQSNKFRFNLWAFIIFACQKASIDISALEMCTYAHEDLFFSYRRNQTLKQNDEFRQLSAIMLDER